MTRTPERITVLAVLRRTEAYFLRAGIESGRLDAEVLLAHVLGIARIQLYTGFDRPLETTELDAYRELVRRRAERVPVAYLTGTKEFQSLVFRVTPDVLVPRPETEHVVEAALARAPASGPVRILDVGTGSGCIAVSVAVSRPEAVLVGTDLSAAALAVAAENAERHGVSDRVEWCEGDLYEPVAGRAPFDLVVSNPPYVSSDEETDPECRREPAGAVFTPGDPVRFYRRLLEGAPEVLSPGGHLVLELPGNRLEEIRAEVPPALEEVEVVADYAGHPRVLVLRREYYAH